MSRKDMTFGGYANVLTIRDSTPLRLLSVAETAEPYYITQNMCFTSIYYTYIFISI
jgi:hypothetical protein